MKRLPPVLCLSFLTTISLPTGLTANRDKPLPEAMVVVEVPARPLARLQPDPLGMVRGDTCENGRLVLVLPDGRRRELLAGFDSACEPDVSFDGKRILFSGRRRASDPWNIFELSLEGGPPRQITRQTGNCRSPIYLSTLFTLDSPEPWSIIAFVSDAAGELNEIGNHRSTSLYSCRLDGSELRRLTFNPSADLDPFQVWDGRIVYSTWEHSLPEHGPLGRFALFSIYSDGTDVSPFVVHTGMRIKQMPAISDRGLCLFVESDRAAPDGGGVLSRVLLKRPGHTYRQLTRPEDGRFLFPSPLPGGRFLVSHLPASGSGTYQVVEFDPETGRILPVHDNPSTHDLHARRVGPRPVPDGRSTVVEDSHATGQVYGISVGIHQLPRRDWLTPDMVRRLRVLEALPRTQHSAGDDESGILRKRILGEAVVEPDGSFFFEVPANTPIQVQLLDEDGLAIQSCSWIWVKNNEKRGCIGCHEHPDLTPPNRLPLAVQRPANQLTLPPARRRTPDFTAHIVPLVAQRCATEGCHAAGGRPDFSRAAGEPDPDYASRLFRLLTMPPEARAGGTSGVGGWIQPGRARTSPLVWHVLGRQTLRPWDEVPATPSIPVDGRRRLDALEAKALIEWIDLGAHGPASKAASGTGPTGRSGGGAE